MGVEEAPVEELPPLPRELPRHDRSRKHNDVCRHEDGVVEIDEAVLSRVRALVGCAAAQTSLAAALDVEVLEVHRASGASPGSCESSRHRQKAFLAGPRMWARIGSPVGGRVREDHDLPSARVRGAHGRDRPIGAGRLRGQRRGKPRELQPALDGGEEILRKEVQTAAFLPSS